MGYTPTLSVFLPRNFYEYRIKGLVHLYDEVVVFPATSTFNAWSSGPLIRPNRPPG